LAILSWIVLIAWIATLIRTILNVLLIPRLRAGAPVDGPLVSVIIPARNEEASIDRTVRGLLAQTYRNLEVIVVDDRSTDATPAILAKITDDRLTVIRPEEPPPGWLGKPWALHQGSLHARGEILLFMDADIRYLPHAVAGAVESLRTPGASMIALLPWFETHGFWENVAMPQLTVFALGFLPTWLSNRTRVVLLAIGSGAGNMIRRADYESIGGHTSLKDSVVDDVALARLARRSGLGTIAVNAVDLVAVRMYRGAREIVNGFTKNLFAVLGRSYFWTIVFAILGVLFHVYPYVMALLGEWISIITVVIITITRLVIFHSARHPLIYALFVHPLMVMFWTWISLRSMWLTGVRRQLVWRARTYDAAQTRFGADR
jgi:chlorobactene glucosyltransferase